MGKRFTDTDTWKKEWFVNLTPTEKAAWFYLKDSCDGVGVWDINFPLANFILGPGIDWEIFREKCNGNILCMSESKWWLVDFCDFQYGPLSPDCKPHKSYINLLTKHNLIQYFTLTDDGYILKDDFIPFRYPLDTVQEKEKEIDKEKDKEKEKEPLKAKIEKVGYGIKQDILLTVAEYDRLVTDYGPEMTSKAIDYLSNYFEEKPKYRRESKSHNGTIRRWVMDAVKERDGRGGKGGFPKGGSDKSQGSTRMIDPSLIE